jgi:hypothetical protein
MFILGQPAGDQLTGPKDIGGTEHGQGEALGRALGNDRRFPAKQQSGRPFDQYPSLSAFVTGEM